MCVCITKRCVIFACYINNERNRKNIKHFIACDVYTMFISFFCPDLFKFNSFSQPKEEYTRRGCQASVGFCFHIPHCL